MNKQEIRQAQKKLEEESSKLTQENLRKVTDSQDVEKIELLWNQWEQLQALYDEP